MPTLKNWRYTAGHIDGGIYGHKDQKRFPDGKRITTSEIDFNHPFNEEVFEVKTKSGSTYKLDRGTGRHAQMLIKAFRRKQ